MSDSQPDSIPRHRQHGVRATILRRYFGIKYRLFRRERRPADGRRGLIMLQIDALPYAELRRAMELGYCPTISKMVREEGNLLRRWFSGLPSATPYAQAGIMYGTNDGIPAFRFYDRAERRVITCNAPAGVQYIRDRIDAPGALAGGSSYVNLLDGDAQTVAFTVATRARTSVYRRLGGTRMVLLLLLHPIRLARMVLQALMEWIREDVDRTLGELARKRTHSEGLFPLIRIFTNVVVRELQTMAVVLDIYLGVPIIYTTFMQYDELAHHFGPSSWQALRDLRRIDARLREIRRMARRGAGREYDIVILSDHGMTPSASYRVRFGETLGRTVQRILQTYADQSGEPAAEAHESFSNTSEYAVLTPQVVETMAAAAPPRWRKVRRRLRRTAAWLRSRYGLRELILPEKYYVGARQQVVVTYSSCLALLYFADSSTRLTHADIQDDPRRRAVYRSLLAHRGVGLVATAASADPAGGVMVESKAGRGLLVDGRLTIAEGESPLAPYGSGAVLFRAIERMASQTNAGDLVMFGDYDGYEIVSFDDQIGAHGSAGGEQVHPFLIVPESLGLDGVPIDDPRDIHRLILKRYASPD